MNRGVRSYRADALTGEFTPSARDDAQASARAHGRPLPTRGAGHDTKLSSPAEHFKLQCLAR